MKRVLFVLLLVSSATFAQEQNIYPVKNSFDLTIGGMGLGLSVNYSRTISVKEKYFVAASAGIGTLPFLGGYSIPHQVTFNLGTNGNFMELGLGGNYWNGKTNSSGYTESTYSYQLAPIIGWRKHFKNNFIFRVYANPLFHVSGEYFYNGNAVVPYLGMSLGYGF